MTFANQLRVAEIWLTEHDERLSPLIRRYGRCRLAPHQEYYAELVSSIVGQQLSVKAADTIWHRVLQIFDNKMPTPRQLLAVDTEKLRAAGLSYAKVAYVKDLAEHILDGRLDMVHVATLPNDELIEQLTAVKGIGEWSAHMFMIFSLGRLDILPVGDLGVRKAAMKIYGLPELPGRDSLEELATENQWHPYESVAAWYLWQSLDNA